MFARKSNFWTKINNFLVRVGAERTVQGFQRTILSQIGDLVPYDASAAWFEMGPTCPLKLCDALGISEEWVTAHNKYYYKIAPPDADLERKKVSFANYKLFRRHTEYYQDFLRPLGIRYGAGIILHDLRGKPSLTLCLTDPKYNYEKDRQIPLFLETIQPHLENYYSYFNLISEQSSNEFYPAELQDGCKTLSKREAEVAGLLCQRLTIAEIASRLLLSPRTVESYVANVYEKLKVRNRRELLERLTARIGK
ncbi:MAG TPA: helix-turn-helix transcriptional regulator [Firmicutes bacterium]|nr:helix-turn-helix transcriptional regulator [Bacillota bacterium]